MKFFMKKMPKIELDDVALQNRIYAIDSELNTKDRPCGRLLLLLLIY